MIFFKRLEFYDLELNKNDRDNKASKKSHTTHLQQKDFALESQKKSLENFFACKHKALTTK